LADVDPAARIRSGNPDLAIRTASAVVMLALVGIALWLGGAVLDGFITLVAIITFFEFVLLIRKLGYDYVRTGALWMAGVVYIGLAGLSLAVMPPVLMGIVLGVVVCTDTGAYFAGRAIGGPKIAPAISPSKTWAGLFGGMAASAIFCGLMIAVVVSAAQALAGSEEAQGNIGKAVLVAAGIGAVLAVMAQAGDFFESWLKRKAGVKDSSRLIPGHGGLFDRVDGLLPVAIIAGAAMASGWLKL
jgi:phosphatidate cytidylyltransferase